MSTPNVLVVQHQDDCPPALVGTWLVEAGCELDVRRPYAGDDLPADLSTHDAMLVLGGSMCANDDDTHQWLGQTKELVRDAATRGIPTLGICLGHQLAAAALGGVVGPNPRGQMLGLVPMGWTESARDDRLLGAAAGAGQGIFWNDDIVLEAPDGTTVLARAPGGEIQAARYAPTVWGLQLHPEVDEAILRAWAEEDSARYAEGEIEAVLSRIATERPDLDATWRPLGLRLAEL
jgi:GMP synthase (glutamine-hydrolysing)